MADQSLIQGARDVAQSKSLKDIGGKAFVGGVTKELERKRQQVELEKKEKEERESIVNSYLDKLGNLQNIEKLGDHNKAKITEWALKKKDEYARAADCYARTKDRGCRENMEKILNAFRNFDAQKNAFDQDKLNYLKNKSNIIEIPGKGEKYSYLFTDNGIMDVEDNGDLGFSVNGEYSKYKDIVGGYTINNFVHATHVLERGLKLPAAVRRDPSLPLDIVFNRSNEKNSISTNLKTTGADGIMAAALINYGFDDDYELSGGKIAGNMTFESMFKSGVLADKFYDGTLTGEVYGTKNENTGLWDLGEDGTNWFWNAGNSSKLNNLISEYSTDVLENQTQLELQKYADLPLGTGGKEGKQKIQETTGLFDSVKKGGSLQLDSVYVNKGELEEKRTAIENREGFYIGENNFRPDKTGDLLPTQNIDESKGWIRETPDGQQTKYKNIKELIISGLRTNHPGFTSLIPNNVDNSKI